MGLPGIFSSIDSYTKKVVHAHMERTGKLPGWFPDVGPVVGCLPVPGAQKYRFLDPGSGVVLTGTPDDILRLRDGSYHIVDYKTARFTGTQDSLFPKYEVQLNAYALIGQHHQVAPVSGLSLIYFEPRGDLDPDGHLALSRDQMNLGFAPRLLPVEMKAERLLPPLLREVRRIHDMEKPPRGVAGCGECAAVEALARAANHP
ncbi:MAG: PD-(D/E)XK nuclease family protein [Euryarchaeota archaeon]|nr:PD-(D/E)XK nuclease family protein [Euryarchaeota archaeon]